MRVGRPNVAANKNTQTCTHARCWRHVLFPLRHSSPTLGQSASPSWPRQKKSRASNCAIKMSDFARARALGTRQDTALACSLARCASKCAREPIWRRALRVHSSLSRVCCRCCCHRLGRLGRRHRPQGICAPPAAITRASVWLKFRLAAAAAAAAATTGV